MAHQLMAGPFLGREAIAAGLVTRHMLRGPSWRPLLPDVYVATDLRVDHRVWCAAVARVLGRGSAIDRYSAAHLHGVDLLPEDAPVSVTVPKATHRWRHPRVRTYRTMLLPDDIVDVDGVPVTTPLRTAFDLGRQEHLTPAMVALDLFCRRCLVSIGQLAEYAGAHRQLRGARMLLRRLPLVDPRAESPMESQLRVLVVMGGLPAPVAQYEVRDAWHRFIARVDLAWPRSRVAVEYEGDHHREQVQFRRDVARLNALRVAGWTVLRFTAPDLVEEPDETIRQIAAAFGRTPRSGSPERHPGRG